MAKEIQCVIGVDIDAVAGWLGSYGGEDSPSDIQRGVIAGEVGTPRRSSCLTSSRSRQADSFLATPLRPFLNRRR